MFILGVIGFSILIMSTLGFLSVAVAGKRQDFEPAKWTVREQMRCEDTLGLPAGCDFSVPVPWAGAAWNGCSFYFRANMASRCRGQGRNNTSNVTGWSLPVCGAAVQSCSRVPGCISDQYDLPNIAMCRWSCKLASP